MKPWVRVSLAAPLLGSALAGCSSSDSSSTPSGNFTQVGNYLDQSVTDKQLSGYSFVVFNGSGTLFKKSGGDETAESVEPLASASKLPSTAAILTLVDQGQLDLDEPVSTYLQGNIVWPQEKSAITMRMLLSHTSGLPDDTALGTPACMTNRNTTTLAICAQEIANAPLSDTPGTTFDYGGVDFQLAGYIATVVSGADSWETFFDNAIGTPLNLSSFTYNPDGNDTNPLIGGGASANANDYATFLQMILNGGSYNGQQILSSNAIAQIQQNAITSGVTIGSSPLPADQYPGYGMGVFIEDSSLYTGSSGPEYCDPGLFGSTPWYDTGMGYGAVLLIVDTATTGVDVANGLRPLVIDAINGASD